MTDRRSFLGMAAGLALGPRLAKDVVASGGSPVARRPSPAAQWDMSWLDQLPAAKHKAVFDATLIQSGLAPGHVDVYLRNYEEVYNVPERDMKAVLVIRHEAVPMILNDAFWAKYKIGEKLRLNDPATGTSTLRNYYGQIALGGRPIPELITLENLHSRGVIILGCNKALMSVAQIMAQAAGASVEQVQGEARSAVLPFVTLMPSGIFAAAKAQEAGCAYIRSA